MSRQGHSALPAKVKAVENRIQKWRKTRRKGSPMPEQLWLEAAGLAKSHGISRISQALRVGYEGLKRRTAKVERCGERSRKTSGFVEVALPEPATQESGPVVELSNGDGAKLTIRLPAHSSVDIGSLASAWWSRRG